MLEQQGLKEAGRGAENGEPAAFAGDADNCCKLIKIKDLRFSGCSAFTTACFGFELWTRAELGQ